jgi:hypothetical protein
MQGLGRDAACCTDRDAQGAQPAVPTMAWSPEAGRIIGHNSVPGRSSAGPGARVLIDVTDAVRRWQMHPYAQPVVLLSSPRTNCLFHGPGAPDADLQPVLKLVAVGGVRDVRCVGCDDPGLSSMDLRVGASTTPRLRFQPIDRSAAIVSARLMLTLK